MTTSAATPTDLLTAPELAALIDHAVLKPTQTERDVVDACTLGRREPRRGMTDTLFPLVLKR